MTELNQISPFEAIRRTAEGGREFWSARDLMSLLGYEKWERMADAVGRAQAACDNSGQDSQDHFPAAGKKVAIGSSAERTVLDYHLTRYAAYLLAMNADPRKAQVAQAQTYFAVQTRRAEVAQAAPAPSSLALARQMLEALEQQDARVAAIEHRLDTAPITSEKVGTIYRLGQELGQVMGDYRRAWRVFKDRFGLASYRDLPSNRFEEAVRFLRVQIAAYTGRPVLLEESPV